MKTIAFKPYSSHPGDHYLSVVLRVSARGEYVTHIKNEQDGGCSSGHYFDNLKDALADFNERGNE